LREAILNAICQGKVPKLDRLSIVRDLRAEMVAGRGACSAATFVAVLTHAFRDDPRYINSPAYVALWEEYVRMAVPPLAKTVRASPPPRLPNAG
jgi:hypothetical protein